MLLVLLAALQGPVAPPAPAPAQAGSSSTPSTVMVVSRLGGSMRSCRARPS